LDSEYTESFIQLLRRAPLRPGSGYRRKNTRIGSSRKRAFAQYSSGRTTQSTAISCRRLLTPPAWPSLRLRFTLRIDMGSQTWRHHCYTSLLGLILASGISAAQGGTASKF
jgi:hypothetical protein